VFLVVGVLLLPGRVMAQTSSSSNYQVEESTFSSGGDINSSSASYNSRATAGVLAVGRGDSTSYSARPGYVTPDEEFLEFVVQTAAVDLGSLSDTTTGTGTALFYVRSYINGSYSVYTLSQAPTSENGIVLDPLTTLAVPTQGIEQFGINMVDNATPNIGANPSHDPGSTFANGEAAPDYDTADSFKYAAGDIIARSGSTGPAWGRTNYTVSYIANVSPITEAGTYVMLHDIVVSATY